VNDVEEEIESYDTLDDRMLRCYGKFFNDCIDALQISAEIK
jgi:hypothetical protein